MYSPRTGRTPRLASLALAVLLTLGSSVAAAAERDDDDGGDGGSAQSTEGQSPDFMSGDFDVLGMRAERTMSQQFRQVSYQVLGTAAVGGLVLGQLDGVRRRAVLPPARLHGSDPQLEIAAGGALEDDIIVTPEPGTILLTGTGLAVVLIGASMKRRKRREARVER